MQYRPSRPLIIVTSVIVTLAVAFVLLLPEIVRRVATNRLGNRITMPVGIADVDINLFTGRAHVENFIIGAVDRPILSVPAFSLSFSPTALFTGRIDVERLVLQNPALAVERIAPDRYNLVEIVKPPSAGNDGGTPSFFIHQIEIQSGEIVFVDRTQDPDYRLTLGSLNLTAGPIATVAGKDAVPATGFNAGFKIGEGSVTVSGTSHVLQNSPSVELQAEISEVGIEAFHVYLPYGGRLNSRNSLVTGHAQYLFASRAGKTIGHSLNANLTIGGFGLSAGPSAQPIAVVSGLQARNVRINFLENKATVEILILENPDVRLERDEQGWNVAPLFQNDGTAQPRNPQQDGTSPNRRMALNLQRVEASGGTIDFIDRTVEPAVAKSFHDAGLRARDVTLLPSFAAPDFVVQAGLDQGTVQVAGALDGQPFGGELKITGTTLPFEPFRGYLNRLFSRARWHGATLNGDLKLALARRENDQVAAELSGRLTGRNVALRFPAEENPFVTSRELMLDLRSLRFGADPRVDIEAIRLAGADLRIVRNKDGGLNLSRLWSADETAQSASANGQTRKPSHNGGSPLVIGGITVEQSAIAVQDMRVSPNYRTQLSRVSGQISELSRGGAPAKVKLEGVLGESARLALTGWFVPFAERTHMHLEGTIRSYALPPLNPYAAEYVSHRIERGQMTLEVDYNLKEGEFEADTHVVLRNVRVGEKTGDEFSRRIGIPLELAVALLEDVNGVIRLDMTLDGKGGPQIDTASLIWRAVRNAIVATISAPFRLIGNVLTLGGRIGGFRIEPILFEPGIAVITPQSAQRLEDMSQLLKSKPQLELRLSGNVSEHDLEVLRTKTFWEKIDTAKGAGYQEALVNVYKDLRGVTQPGTPLSPTAEAALERFVMAHIEISPKTVADLAQSRAELVRQELIKRGVDSERLLTTAQAATAADAAPGVSIELVS